MKIKILFVIDGIEFGGGERCFAQIIEGLPAYGYEIYLASARNRLLYDAVHNCHVHCLTLDFSKRFNPVLFARLTRFIKEEGIDIVHGQGARAEFYARIASGLAKTSKYVSTIAMPVEGYDVGTLQKIIYGYLDRNTERYVDRFIVVSDTLKENMINRHTVPGEKIVRIYNGIEIDLFNPDNHKEQRTKIRNEFSLGNEIILVGAIGRLVWQKGFEYFLQCMPEVINMLPQVKFLLVGDGPLKRTLKNLSMKLAIGDHIVFTGQRNDIRDILSALDIVVVPSLLEGFPMIILEAMAMKKPIAATRINGIIEQIRDGKEGILVPPRRQDELTRVILRIACDPDLASALGNAARQRVMAEFSVEQMITETIKVYDGLS